MHILIPLLPDPEREGAIVSVWGSQCQARTLLSSMKNISRWCQSSKLNVVWVILKYFNFSLQLGRVLPFSLPLATRHHAPGIRIKLTLVCWLNCSSEGSRPGSQHNDPLRADLLLPLFGGRAA